ncbi:MAG: HIT family protein [Bacteroidota bacterium]
MASIFSKIVQGEIPSYKIAEDDHFYAFLDIFPITKGHTLVIPKAEVDYIFDLDDEVLAGLHLFSKKVAQAIKKAYPCERISVIVAGFEVPHAHVHLIPSNTMEDLDFRHKLKFSEDEFREMVSNIQAHLSA